MNVEINFTDDGVSPGTLHGEVSINFNLKTENALEVVKKLQASNVPAAIAAALSRKDEK